MFDAEEGRVKLRKAMGSCTKALIHRYPNGETRQIADLTSARKVTSGTETSKYRQEKRTKVIPKVVASELGEAQTRTVQAVLGL